VMAAYVATFLAWPFDDQMSRFIFPALPVLVLYAFWAMGRMADRLGKPSWPAYAFAAVLLLVLIVPAMGFIYQRARMPVPQVAITDWYRTPNLLEARARANAHLDLLAAMDMIRAHTRSDDRVMWVTPAYLALLAERQGVRAPSQRLEPAAYRAAVREARPDYVFLSAYHPRNTISDQAWQAGLRALYGELTAVHVGTSRGGELVTYMLLKPN
jgi:hypothetical protein